MNSRSLASKNQPDTVSSRSGVCELQNELSLFIVTFPSPSSRPHSERIEELKNESRKGEAVKKGDERITDSASEGED